MLNDSEDCYAKESILIVGAGELGTAVLKSVAGHSARKAKVGVLLRPLAVDSENSKQLQYERVRALGAEVVECDLASTSATDLAR